MVVRRRSGTKPPDVGAARSRTSKAASCTTAGVKTRRGIGRGGGSWAVGVGDVGRGGGAVVSGGNVGNRRGFISRLGATFGGGVEPAGCPSASRKRRMRSSSVGSHREESVGQEPWTSPNPAFRPRPLRKPAQRCRHHNDDKDDRMV
jgi:hypothetical protein